MNRALDHQGPTPATCVSLITAHRAAGVLHPNMCEVVRGVIQAMAEEQARALFPDLHVSDH